MFSGAIFAFTNMKSFARYCLLNSIGSLKRVFNFFSIFIIKILHATLIFFSRQLFIKKYILFLPLAYRTETILAAHAVVAKCAIRAVFEILRVIAAIAVVNIYAFVAKFAIFAIIVVCTVARI